MSPDHPRDLESALRRALADGRTDLFPEEQDISSELLLARAEGSLSASESQSVAEALDERPDLAGVLGPSEPRRFLWGLLAAAAIASILLGSLWVFGSEPGAPTSGWGRDINLALARGDFELAGAILDQPWSPRGGAVRSGAERGRIQVFEPVHKCRTPTPSVRFSVPDDTQSATLEIRDASGFRFLSTTVSVPAGQRGSLDLGTEGVTLERGRTYVLSIVEDGRPGRRSDHHFTVTSAADTVALEGELERVERRLGDSPAAHLARASVLSRHQITGEAGRELGGLLQELPAGSRVQLLAFLSARSLVHLAQDVREL